MRWIIRSSTSSSSDSRWNDASQGGWQEHALVLDDPFESSALRSRRLRICTPALVLVFFRVDASTSRPISLPLWRHESENLCRWQNVIHVVLPYTRIPYLLQSPSTLKTDGFMLLRPDNTPHGPRMESFFQEYWGRSFKTNLGPKLAEHQQAPPCFHASTYKVKSFLQGQHLNMTRLACFLLLRSRPITSVRDPIVHHWMCQSKIYHMPKALRIDNFQSATSFANQNPPIHHLLWTLKAATTGDGTAGGTTFFERIGQRIHFESQHGYLKWSYLQPCFKKFHFALQLPSLC